MPLHLITAAKTDVGKQREQNEDACFTHVYEHDQQTAGLFVVADGMGGYHAGEVASKIAVESIGETLQPLLGPATSQPTVRLKGKGRRGKVTAILHRDDPAKTRPLTPEPAEEPPAEPTEDASARGKPTSRSCAPPSSIAAKRSSSMASSTRRHAASARR